MAMSNAERQRKFRLNRDINPEKRAAYLRKEKDRNVKKTDSGIIKNVQAMTEREKRAARKKWRSLKRKARARAKEHVKTMQNIVTPPSTPGSNEHAEDEYLQSRQKQQSSKKKKRQVAKCFRDNDLLKKELEKQKLLTQKYRKRLQRQPEMLQKQECKADTPRTRTRTLLRHYPKKIVRKTLVFQSALIDQIKERYKNKL